MRFLDNLIDRENLINSLSRCVICPTLVFTIHNKPTVPISGLGGSERPSLVASITLPHFVLRALGIYCAVSWGMGKKKREGGGYWRYILLCSNKVVTYIYMAFC